MWDAWVRVYQDLYEYLDSEGGEKDTYRIVWMREKARDLCTECIGEDYNIKVLEKDTNIKGRWKKYFDQLFNAHFVQDISDLNILLKELNHDFLCRITSES